MTPARPGEIIPVTSLAMAPNAPMEYTPPSETAVVLAVIERAARDPQVDIDKLERLLQMRERIASTAAKAAYSAALAQMQPELPTIAERGAIKNNSGAVQSKYALWEDVVAAITPVLSRHGFALSFRTGNGDKTVTVTGVLSHRDGHSEETALTLPIDTSGSKNAVQSVGSSTSYGKRYTSAALLNLRTGEADDDGQAGPVAAATVTQAQANEICALVNDTNSDPKKFLAYIDAARFEDILASKYAQAVASLQAKRKAAK